MKLRYIGRDTLRIHGTTIRRYADLDDQDMPSNVLQTLSTRSDFETLESDPPPPDDDPVDWEEVN